MGKTKEMIIDFCDKIPEDFYFKLMEEHQYYMELYGETNKEGLTKDENKG